VLRFWGFLAGLGFVLHFGLWNAEDGLHGARELYQGRFAFDWLRLHGFIIRRLGLDMRLSFLVAQFFIFSGCRVSQSQPF
jgi:hypothetical protein